MTDAPKPTHTPAPWSVLVEHLRGGRYSSVERPGRDEPIDIHHDDNGEADARLIAAAPLLFDALEKVTIAAEEAANVLAQQYPGFASIIRANVDAARAALAAASTGADDR